MTLENATTLTKKYPEPPEGVMWPNHLHTDAKHPSAEIRMDIMREVLGGEGDYDYADHDAYPFVLSAIQKLRTKFDAYLFRQYYHRDLVVQALKDGDTRTALSHLREIGV